MKGYKPLLAVLLGLCACGESSDDSGGNAGATLMPSPQMAGVGGTSGVGGSGGAAGSAGTLGQIPDPPIDETPAGSGGAGGAGGTTPIMDPPIEVPPEDNCDDRRVSYAHPCTNDPNPCGIDSGFFGDEYCLPPPPEGEGFQIHIGPDDYANPDEVAKYVIEAGEEFNNSVLGHIPIEEDAWFNRITVHMRPGSHHWISSVVDGRLEERVYAGTDCEGAPQVGSIGGGQNLIYDNPPKGVPAPENEGLGRPIAGKSSLCMNLHAYNFTEEQQLRELWINIYTVPESAVTQRGGGIGIVGGLGMSIAPGESETLTYTDTFAEPGRIIQLFGHRHVWTPRFAVWLNDDLIYESWDWQESVTYNFDSLTNNPPINTAGMTDGAASGVIEVQAGDKLKFSCFIENDSEMTLRFSNELRGGEMCNLWGTAVGTSLSGTHF